MLFRDRAKERGAFSKFLSENAFGVYVFHAPILVAVSLFLLKPWGAHPLAKWEAVALILLPLAFAVVFLLRKIPGLKRVFS